MANRDKAKERKRLKREKKRREQAKRQQQQERTLSWATGAATCYLTEDWIERGIGNLLVLRESSGNRWAFAGFLVDLWCIGLKDAFGHDEYTPADFDEVLQRSREAQDFKAIPLDEARQIVAAGVRWARMHDFRLPKGWEKAASIFGALGDVDAADVSKFGAEGGLHYVGRYQDLVSRLTGCSVEEFMKKPGVKVTIMDDLGGDGEEGDDVDESDDRFAEALEGMVDTMAEKIANEVRKWCFRHKQLPAAELEDACSLASVLLLEAVRDGEVEMTPGSPIFCQRLRDAVAEDKETDPAAAPLDAAAEQLIAFTQSTDGAAALGSLLERMASETEHDGE